MNADEIQEYLSLIYLRSSDLYLWLIIFAFVFAPFASSWLHLGVDD